MSDRFKIHIFLSERSVKFSISGLFFYQEPFHANMVTDLPYAQLGFDIFAFHRSVDPVDPDDKGKYTIWLIGSCLLDSMVKGVLAKLGKTKEYSYTGYFRKVYQSLQARVPHNILKYPSIQKLPQKRSHQFIYLSNSHQKNIHIMS